MKKFSEFIVEARSSQAAQKAHKLGLQGDGHGYWIDKQQKRVAQTVKGQLQFISGKKKGKSGEDGDGEEGKEPSRVSTGKFRGQKPGKKRLGAKAPQPTAKRAPAPAATPRPKATAQEPTPKPKETIRDEVVTVVFGKFNPPTQAHKRVLESAKKTASGGNFYVFPSRTQDGKKNPLDPDTKISYMKEMFPEYADSIIDSDEFQTIFDVLQFLNQEGYTGVNIVCGAERVSEIDNLANKSNGQLYDYQSINVVSSGSKDAESESGSSDVARKAAAEKDFETFKKALPSGFSGAKQMFTDLQQSMNIKEGYRLWEIAPEYDWKGLRENYVFGHLYQVGTIIESCNTGLIGKVIRSGANHLICVTEDGIMFKSWIKDVCEYTEVKMDKMTREPGKPNTLVGTVGYTKYVASMTPGATVDTINKKRKELTKSK
jgi:hypothetical protein